MRFVNVGDVGFMQGLADAADALTGDGWGRGDLTVELKSDGSPTTAIDLAVEAKLRDLIRQRFPADGFVGEEVGTTDGSSERQWIVDGIDGTTAFVQGRPEWSTLVSLVIQNDAVVTPLGRLPESVVASIAMVHDIALCNQPLR